MVLQKRLDYGFNGYQAPHVPRAARSARRRGPLRKNVGDSQMYAFDLLATIAGKILLEGQNPTSSLSNGKLPDKDVLVPLKEEQHEPNRSLEDSSEGHASEITSSGCSDKIIYNEKTVLSSSKSDSVSQFRNVEACSSGLVGSCVPKLENHAEGQIESMQVDNVGEAPMGVGANSCISDGPKVFHGKAPSALVSSDNTVKPNILKSYYRCSSVFSSRDDYVGVVSKDDDDKSSQCMHRSAFIKRSKVPARVVDRKIRKLLGSRHWRVPSRVKDEDLSDNGGKFHSSYQCRKFGYNRQRSHRIYPLKKRKLLHYKSSSHSSDTSGSDGIRTSSEEATVDLSASGFGNDMFPSATESQVKLKIKSFRVPELVIEMPETATVGSLKRTVLEAISAFLGGELGIGVLVEGRKIRDDSKTLLQTGISHKNQPDALGFTLEPISSQVCLPMCLDNLHLRDIAPPIVSGTGDPSSQATSSMAHRLNPPPSPDYLPNSIANVVESDHDSAPSPVEISREKTTADESCRALVTVPELKAAALAVVPPPQKYKRSEIAQRRIRRPFSVTEVEALVQAVEKLGTGRWRDVKLRAFDNIKHRTYVDLKDKWKTLVHTAKISPQQRRGAPVPQELLDRVLAAHAYWSQHQAKQHVKHHESRLQSCEEY